ncbi:hypothetical protein B0H14DRAFT_2606347 [Mycena olivaceomarginata]|nr:hypothetical protein B0H14DRAFT_2606347 [Mycena olivaceomarginata]
MPRDDLLAIPVATRPRIAPSLHELALHVDPRDLKILVLLHALLILQGAPAALHMLALDVAYITDDHEPLDAHPALVLAVVPSLYMLHAELAFRSGDAASGPFHDPCFLHRAVHLREAYNAVIGTRHPRIVPPRRSV